MKIVFASSNRGKIKEIQALLARHHEVLGLEDIGITADIPETGKTIAENSYLKTKFVVDFLAERDLSYAVFADDSGLEVEALDNAPGVFSARFAGEPKSDEANNSKLLSDLKLVMNRKARFITIITLISEGKTRQFEGIINGTIAHEPRGMHGFGYDPLFIPQGYRSTFAELKPEIKNAISHRSIAVKKLVEHLEIESRKKTV